MVNLDESAEEINGRFGIPNVSPLRKSKFPDLTLALSDEDEDDQDLGLNSSGILNTRNNSPEKKKYTSLSPPKRVSNDYQDHMSRMRSNPVSPLKSRTKPSRNLFVDDESTEKYEYIETHSGLGDIGAKKIRAAIDGLSKKEQEGKPEVRYRDLYNDKDKLATQLLIINSDLMKENSKLRENERKNQENIMELRSWITGLQEKTKKYKQLYLKAQRKLNDIDQEKTEEVPVTVNVPVQTEPENQHVGVSLEDVKCIFEKLNDSIDKLMNNKEKPKFDNKDINEFCQELISKVKDGLKQSNESPKQYFTTRPPTSNVYVQVPSPPPTNQPVSAVPANHIPPPVPTHVSTNIPLSTSGHNQSAGTSVGTSTGTPAATHAPPHPPAPTHIPTATPVAPTAPPPPQVHVPTPPPAAPSPVPPVTFQFRETNPEPPKSQATTLATSVESHITQEQLNEIIKSLTKQTNSDPHIYVDCRLCFDSKEKKHMEKNGICKRCTKEVLSADTTLNKLGGEWLSL